ncbi:Hypp1644 [Branchiostoma lanceolatum]|uniref:Hypp1644 protein n=1 Tax=Branchiostoma lanceolatum TaxID=7740 RepID=A0A8K0EP53_BRALA|nr:Hypp1644 [Branchiostoma lanceolatum]
MSEGARSVRTSPQGAGGGQTSGPPPKTPPGPRGGAHGDARGGNAGSKAALKGRGASTPGYEDAEPVKVKHVSRGPENPEEISRHVNLLYTTDTSTDSVYSAEASSRCAFWASLRTHRRCACATVAIVATLVGLGITMVVMNGQISKYQQIL